jgi:hypothetical protein
VFSGVDGKPAAMDALAASAENKSTRQLTVAVKAEEKK